MRSVPDCCMFAFLGCLIVDKKRFTKRPVITRLKGYFSEFGMVWEAVSSYISKNNSEPNQELFDNLLDLFPEFLRPNIFSILEYLKRKKIKSKCNKLILYTNNQGPKEWAKSIIQYFETKRIRFG